MESRATYFDPALRLKSTPPRAVRNYLDRERLSLRRLEADGVRLTALVAPPGFGKTSQMIHWRREALAGGGLAFWHTLDDRDEPMRFLRGLAHCAQANCGKRGFSDSAMQWIETCTDPQAAMTGWLAEVADLSVDVLLLLDDAHLLPAATRDETLPYLLGNAPANLHVALATRSANLSQDGGPVGTAQICRVTASDLRFQFGETMTVLSSALGGRCSPEAGLQLHELIEGWPLGVQLAAAALRRSGDLEGFLATAKSDIRRYFIETLIDRQSADAMCLLVMLAQFDLIHPDLCAAALGRDDLREDLARLQEETPLFVRAEGNDWSRLHPVARDVLRERAARLPPDERRALAHKASTWYAAQGLYEEAAQQSLLADDAETAVSLIEHQAFNMAAQGRHSTVLSWFHRLSSEDLDRHPGFLVPAAWGFAMSDQRPKAEALVERILTRPDLAPDAKFEAALIRTVAATYSDRGDIMMKLLDEWPEPPTTARPVYLPVYFNLRAFVALYRGRPDLARLEWRRMAELDPAQTYAPVTAGVAAYGAGLTHLWEGKCALAAQELRPALIWAEDVIGRHSPVAAMLAALLAEACWECGKDDAPALLAGRLSVIDQNGLPEAMISAYRTLARVAHSEGRQDQSLTLLESLLAIGQARRMPRIEAAARFELIRLHARHGRRDSARRSSNEIASLLAHRAADTPEPSVRWLQLHAEMANAYASLAAGDTAAGLLSAQSAVDLAASLMRGGDLVEARFLLAEAFRRRGSVDARAALDEAISLAQAGGMSRIVGEHTPNRRETATAPIGTIAGGVAPAIGGTSKQPIVLGAGLLTSKEREVLTLLSQRLSNKEIARAMDVGEQTIKWHIKNIFSKLDAASRNHAVARARMLGLLDVPPDAAGSAAAPAN